MLILILYSKPGCHLCEGLQEKLESISTIDFSLEVRDITQNQAWYDAYQYEVPVLAYCSGETEHLIPRPSPRISVTQLEKKLMQALSISQ